MTGLSHKQKEIRRTRGGGSSIPTYLGFNPYASPLQGVRQARGLEEVKESDEMRGGTVLEDGIAELMGLDLGIETHKPDTTYHPIYPEAIAVHFDRLCDEEQLGIQIKNHWPFIKKASYKGNPRRGTYHNDLVPTHIHMQCQIEMMVAECAFGGKWGEQWVLAAYFGGAKPICYWIRRHKRLQDAILKKFLVFWKQHLDPEGPQTEPENYRWVGSPTKTTAPVKGDMMSVVLPFESKYPSAFKPQMPFMEE